MDNRTAFYKKLKEILDKEEQWPLSYMFKFVCPNKSAVIASVEEKIAGTQKMQRKVSRNGNFVSLTIVMEMPDSKSIIDKYRSVEEIQGLIAL